jgi:hypothetical protein
MFSKRPSDADLLRFAQFIDPTVTSVKITERYLQTPFRFSLANGDVVTGYVETITDFAVIVRDPVGKIVTVKKTEVAAVQALAA